MVRDKDYLRELLLKIEATDYEASNEIENDTDDEVILKKLNEHLTQLMESGLINSPEKEGPGGWFDLRLTSRGHDYLDNIRDPEIWRKTKESAQKVGGISLDILGALAKGLLKKQIEKHTGVEIDL